MSADGDRAGLDARLRDVVAQYEDVQTRLATPEVTSDPDAIRTLGRELARLEPVVQAFRALESTRHELAGARELRDGGGEDPELRAMAADEI